MAKNVKTVRHPQKGFGKVMVGINTDEVKARIKEANEKRKSETERLTEKFSAMEDLALPKTKIEEMMHENPKNTANLLIMLENSERGAMQSRKLVENMKIQEEIADSNFLGITPQDIVKVVRIAYANSVAQDIFDFWAMSSMKDSIYKLENLYGSMLNASSATDSSPRGATAGGVTYEDTSDGRYPSEDEHDTVAGTTTGTDTYSGTLTYFPLIAFQVRVYLEGEQIAVDDGNGVLVGTILTGTNTINYTTGDYVITMDNGTITTGDELIFSYHYNSENEDLHYRTGSVVLNLVEYDFRARPWPMALEWTRMTEMLMESKLGMSAKDQLITSAGDVFRKSTDEYCVAKGIRAANWTTAVAFDADYASSGSDSATEHAQGVLSKVIQAELKTYASLNRYADKTNILVGTNAYSYLTKHKKFTEMTPPSRMGIHKVGELAGRGVYLAPAELVVETSTTGLMYLMGKGNDPMSTDAVVSVGTYRASISTDPVEFKHFNSEMGLAMVGDIKTNNREFATWVQINNIDKG